MTTQDTSRLDRIEKNLDLLMMGILDLKESQKKTDEHILELKNAQLETNAQQRKTDGHVLELINAQLETNAHQRKTDEHILELNNSKLDIDTHILDLKNAHNETEALFAGTVKRLDEVRRQLVDLGLVRGEVE